MADPGLSPMPPPLNPLFLRPAVPDLRGRFGLLGDLKASSLMLKKLSESQLQLPRMILAVSGSLGFRLSAAWFLNS